MMIGEHFARARAYARKDDLWSGLVIYFVAAVVLWILAVSLGAIMPAKAEVGVASWYGYESGTHTANGERWRPMGITAAHRTLPFGTRVRVTDLATKRTVVVRISDRGPARWTRRIIDLSRGAALELGIIHRGTARVSLEILR
jgi:rare lipoprotein A